MSGKLIVLEGLDGSGKATQTTLLCNMLRTHGCPVRHLEFPDYSHPSSALVRMYLEGEFGSQPQDVNAYGASSFYAVDRYASYLKFWKQEYEAGGVMVADRYTTSNAIYQMVKLERGEWNNYLQWLQDYEYERLRLPKPDAVIYLDMPTEISQRLMSKRYQGDETKKDLHESNVAFLAQCREAALYSAQALGWRVVPCAQGQEPRRIEAIHEDVFAIIREVFDFIC